MTSLRNVDVVVLAGGLGTRLRSVFADVPKVLAPVLGRPFLHYLLEQIKAAGARRVVLALGHLAEQVEAYAASRPHDGLEIVTCVEPCPRGTGGGLREALPAIGSETVLVMNGDSYVAADLGRFVEFHLSRPAAISMVLTHEDDVGRYGVVQTDADGRVTSYMEKPPAQAAGDINAGLYLVNRPVIEAIAPGRSVSLERDVFPHYCGRGLYAMRGEFAFIDVGTPESYRRAEAFFAEQGHDH